MTTQAGTATQGASAAALGVGQVGIWSVSARFAPDGVGPAAAAELEEMGFPMLWIPGGVDSGVLASIDQLLDATETMRIGSGILNVWKHEPAEVAAWWLGQAPRRRERIVLGLGVSHGPVIGEAYQKPLAKMRSFLDALFAAGMAPDHVCLAALGPKMLELAAERTAGACPYLVSPGHTATARQAMGAAALLAPEQGVVLETDPAKARTLARAVLQHYAGLPNYTNSWLREGFSQDDIDTLSDRLVDGLIAWGDLDAIRARIDAHLAAGADHVCLQVIGGGGMARAIDQDRQDWRALAALLDYYRSR